MTTVDFQAIRNAAAGIRSEVLPKLADLKTMTAPTEVSFPHFGVILPHVNNSYQHFRTYLADSIQAAYDQMDTAQQQLDRAAKHWEAVEVA